MKTLSQVTAAESAEFVGLRRKDGGMTHFDLFAIRKEPCVDRKPGAESLQHVTVMSWCPGQRRA